MQLNWLDLPHELLDVIASYSFNKSIMRCICSKWRKQFEKQKINVKAASMSIEMFNWAIENSFPADDDKLTIVYTYIIARGDLEMLKKLYSLGYRFNTIVYRQAIINGKLEIIEWLKSINCPTLEYTCDIAARHGHLHILQWARERNYYWDYMICAMAAKGGHLHVLKWARKNHCPWNEQTCSNAAIGGHLKMLKWAIKNGCKYKSLLDNAMLGGDKETIDWILNANLEP